MQEIARKLPSDGIYAVPNSTGPAWDLWPNPCHTERPVLSSGMMVMMDDDNDDDFFLVTKDFQVSY